jgi:cytochrome c-type biogenesis protein
VLGVALLGGIPWLLGERRLEVAHRLPRKAWASYLVGLAFAVGWTPCVGPILAAVLLEAASSSTAAIGALLLAAYSAGLGLPFLAAAAFVRPVSALIRHLRGIYPVINITAAVLLIAVGILTLTNRLTTLNAYFPNLAPVAEPAHLTTTPSSRGAGGAMVGRPVPTVTITGVKGNEVSLASLRGRPVIVTFWATWCVPCRDELPLFASAYRSNRSQGLDLVAIDYEESTDAVSRFWKELGLEPDPYVDPNGGVARRFGIGLQQTGLPMTFLLGRDGRVRAVFPGQVDPALFNTRLEEILRS